MFIFVFFKDPPELSLNARRLSSLEEDVSQEKMQLVNPNCPVRIMLEYIRKKSRLAEKTLFDLCDDNGNMKKLFSLPTYAYATHLFDHKKTYYVVVYKMCLIGMECQSFAIIAADQLQTKSIAIVKNDVNKLHEIKNKIIFGVNGDPGDIEQFTQYVDKNISLYSMRNGYDLSTDAVVHFTRKTQLECSFIVNSLIGGFDEERGGQLYYIDAMGSFHRLEYATHGYAGFFPLSLLQNEYHRNLTKEQAYEILEMCVCEITQRMFLNMGSFRVKVVDKDGITELPVITGTCYF